MLDEFLNACKEWVNSVQKTYADKIKVEIEKDSSELLVANLDTDVYLSQIAVSKPECRPYNFVEFTVFDSRREAGATPVFWYGDKEGDTVQEIVDRLNEGLKVLLG